jgi:outer membrane protein assembly factor BamB
MIKTLWELSLGNTGRYSFGVVSDTLENVYFTTEMPTNNDRILLSVTPLGQLRWQRPLYGNTNAFGGPAIGLSNQIHVPCVDGCIYTFAQNDGRAIWQFRTSYAFYSSPCMDDLGNMYIGNNNGQFFSVDISGTQRWSYQANGQIFDTAVIDKNKTVYFAASNYLYSMSLSGAVNWGNILEKIIIGSPSLDRKGNLYLVTSAPKMISISPDGYIRWQTSLGSRGSFFYSAPAINLVGQVFVAADHLYIFSTEGDLLRISKQALNENESCPVVLDRESNAYISMLSGDVYSFNSEANLLWNFNFGMHQGMLLNSNGGLFIVTTSKAILLAGSGDGFVSKKSNTYLGGKDSLIIHPNPFSNYVSISYDISSIQPNKDVARLRDLNGRVVYKWVLNKRMGKINWNGNYSNGLTIPPGYYFFEIGNRRAPLIKI